MTKTEETWSEGKRVREAIKLINHCIDIQGKCKRMREKEIKWVDIKALKEDTKLINMEKCLALEKAKIKQELETMIEKKKF